MPTEIIKAYIAGFIDGEGCINISKVITKDNTPYYNLRLSIAQKVKKPLELISKYYFDGTLYLDKSGGKNFRDSDKTYSCYKYQLNGEKAYRLLNDIEKYIYLKKEEVQLGLQFRDMQKMYFMDNLYVNDNTREIYYKLQEEYYQEMKAMKHRN